MKKSFYNMCRVSALCMFYLYNGGTNAAGLMRSMTSMQIVKDMKVGWNLGNTLDAWMDGATGLKTETCWGIPKTTKVMFDTVKAKGFKTIRVPVTWRNHFGAAPSYTIDPAWLDRVEEVVNYALDGKTYVILNSHHDEWVTLTEETKTTVSDKITKIWAQIAERFKDYDDYLLFETLNEPRLYGTADEWTGGTTAARSILNEYNAAIVQTIRSSGGNNALRHIMIPTYCATSMAVAQNGLVIPANDTRIIVSQHVYFPYYFTMDTSLATSTNQWGSAADKTAMDTEFDRMYNRFIKNGIPVVIGEWGSINKSNNEDARVAHAKYYMAAAYKKGICAVWWDNNLPKPAEQTFGLLDRATCTWSHPEIADAIIESAGGNTFIIRRSEKMQERNSIFEPQYGFSRLYNLQGKEISGSNIKSTGAGNISLSLNKIASGIYLLNSGTVDCVKTRCINEVK